MDIIIIGAGAAGLMVSKILVEAGYKVLVLEARDRIGGRVHTFTDGDSDIAKEAGAEFIHGKLELTMKLLKEAGIDAIKTQGEIWQFENGEWEQENDFTTGFDVVMKRLEQLKEDMSVADFLQQYLGGEEHADVRESIIGYVEGYYSADTHRASAKALLKGLQSEDEEQFRPGGGYGRLLEHLAFQCTKAGGTIQLSTVVKEIRWTSGSVEVVDENSKAYTASKVLITVPLGVWTAASEEEGAITYSPALPAKQAAAMQLGFGAAIKVLVEFDEVVWQNDTLKQLPVDVKQMQFALTDLPIPTWWTQLPANTFLLTGWLSGPKAKEMKDEPEEVIVLLSLASLSKMFSIDIETLHRHLKWWKVFNWTNDPFTRGSYSYVTTETAEACKTLAEPVADTLFFAGEALYTGTENGTVEAALISGKEAAAQILS